MAIVSLPLPIQLINGNPADGGQVMTDLNSIASNVNANAAKNGINSDITALLALTSIGSGLTITGATINASSFVGGTITGTAIDSTSTVPTAPAGTNNTTIASTAYVVQTAFSAALPGISPAVANYFVTNNGAIDFWSNILLTNTIMFADSNNTTKRIAFDASQIPPNTTVTLSVPGGSTNIVLSNTPDYILFSQGVI